MLGARLAGKCGAETFYHTIYEVVRSLEVLDVDAGVCQSRRQHRRQSSFQLRVTKQVVGGGGWVFY